MLHQNLLILYSRIWWHRFCKASFLTFFNTFFIVMIENVSKDLWYLFFNDSTRNSFLQWFLKSMNRLFRGHVCVSRRRKVSFLWFEAGHNFKLDNISSSCRVNMFFNLYVFISNILLRINYFVVISYMFGRGVVAVVISSKHKIRIIVFPVIEPWIISWRATEDPQSESIKIWHSRESLTLGIQTFNFYQQMLHSVTRLLAPVGIFFHHVPWSIVHVLIHVQMYMYCMSIFCGNTLCNLFHLLI